MIPLSKYLFLIALMLNTLWLSGQSFFLSLPDDQETYNRRINRFSNDDILIADSSDDGVTTESNGKVFLIRMDNCGEVVWSRSFERSTEYLEFKDVKLDHSDNIYVYGSAYRGGQEMLFLLKVAGDGKLINFRLIQTGTVDHFSYSMDLKNGRIMLYGLLLDFNTQKQGFLSLFDESLDHLWGKRFAPFESEGNAIIDSKNRFVCRSGAYHYVLDQDGNLEWASEVDLQSGALPIAGPCEVPGGYVYQAYRDQNIFYYKLDYEGRLTWKSQKIPAKRFVGDMSAMPDGTFLVTYNQSMMVENFLTYLVIDSHTGAIIEHNYLTTDASLDVERVYHSLDLDGNLRILGNKVLLERYSIDIPYFLIQTPLVGRPSDDCFSWSPLSMATNNEIPLIFSPIDTVIFNTRMTALPADGATTATAYTFPVGDICDLQIAPQVIMYDTLLACGKEWQVTLPSDKFTWEDAPYLKERTLVLSGVYRASNRDCRQPVVYEFRLSRPDCSCGVYLPNAITVNDDGLNDIFNIYSECEIINFRLTVFNRWGMKVFEGNDGWDGRIPKGNLEQGLYIVKIDYHLVDASGKPQLGTSIQELLILR